MSRLTIQYTIEMEEIEGEVNRLIHKAISLLAEVAEKEPPTDKMLSYVALDHLDEIRKNLNKIDHNLNDATNIIEGYLRYRSAQTAQEQMEDYQTEQNEIPASD